MSGKSQICVLARLVTAARRGFKMVLFTASVGTPLSGEVRATECLLIVYAAFDMSLHCVDFVISDSDMFETVIR